MFDYQRFIAQFLEQVLKGSTILACYFELNQEVCIPIDVSNTVVILPHEINLIPKLCEARFARHLLLQKQTQNWAVMKEWDKGFTNSVDPRLFFLRYDRSDSPQEFY